MAVIRTSQGRWVAVCDAVFCSWHYVTATKSLAKAKEAEHWESYHEGRSIGGAATK